MTPGTRSASRPARTGAARARRGAESLARARIVEIQRARILAGTFDVVCERGAGGVSVADIVERSGVSRRTFYEVFSDREDCFLAAFETVLATAREVVLPAYLAKDKWHQRIRAGLVALLCFLDEEPKSGRLLVCESLVGGPKMLRQREQALALLTRAVDGGRALAGGATRPPALTAESLVGGVLSVIYTRLSTGREPLAELTNQLMSMIVLPYLGPAAARRELERPLPAPVRGGREAMLPSNPFKHAGMRITYRTVRVLSAVAELGEHGVGPSNRVVGEHAEISDQGQVSKLLGRLQRIGLITNSSHGGPAQGTPNAWTLTPLGEQLANSIQVNGRNS